MHRESTVLVVIDVQERLLAALPPDSRAPLVQNAVISIEAAKVLGMPILVTEQYPKGLGPTIAEIMDHVAGAQPPVSTIEKIVFSCGRSPEFKAALGATGKRDVWMFGVETHVCVLQTALDLLRDGYRVYVPADAVQSRRDLDRDTGLALMRQAGATIGTTEIFLFQLLERAGTAEFKQISALVR